MELLKKTWKRILKDGIEASAGPVVEVQTLQGSVSEAQALQGLLMETYLVGKIRRIGRNFLVAEIEKRFLGLEVVQVEPVEEMSQPEAEKLVSGVARAEL